jgi:hypothetical protein
MQAENTSTGNLIILPEVTTLVAADFFAEEASVLDFRSGADWIPSLFCAGSLK